MNMEIKKRIFVFSGKQGSGKSTYAAALREFIGEQDCKIFKFADTLYRLHDACLPILKETGIIPQNITKEGKLLQVLGTEYGSNCIGRNVWVDVTRRAVDNYLLQHSSHYAIIDDCRFENEFDAFHPIANMIRLSAPREVRKARCSSWRDTEDHISETGLDAYEKAMNFDAVIDTSGGSKDTEPAAQLEWLLSHLEYINV